MSETPLLSVRGLSVEFLTRHGNVSAVDSVSFDLRAGETLALVGESGSGKSACALALMGLTTLPGRVAGGQVLFDGQDLLAAPPRVLEDLRGNRIAMVFQDPMSALNPLLAIGTQIDEVLVRHTALDRAQRRARIIELLGQVGIPKPAERLDRLPHEFSGGQRQRILIAMALACDPQILIADEPTTALDVTIQAQILDLLAELKQRLGLAMLLVTHDLGVVAKVADRVAVMYAGRLVELADADALFAEPAHPYTAGLLRATPRLTDTRHRMIAIDGVPPDLRLRRSHCDFAPRCPGADAACAQRPALRDIGHGRLAACVRPSAPVWMQDHD
ncbi:ABC transporter ATP-binding protein [Achromobacter marplatensis]|uniref:Oligopeptide transport system ATP-binding protein n=1 Tax=Achromobacter marplatensis TaxID=470868 RepID=A0ABX9GHV2_9BURK|nr:ABC transporter ATP-binding protein [Achromobacter marplatensis]OWT72557.1 ABC transporter ATP-binding protein [Achromobacter marplatensis]RBP24134.1 oligopeptide transport system ATP-binding protein [Achromobacter marplatensis]CAB3628201.1 Oligopeptide transport ATP-binding protein OppD [Achromobacter marplatensis]